MYCKQCGSRVQPEYLYCQHCGAPIERGPQKKAVDDSGSGGFWALGFFLPVVGLILYVVLGEDRPRRAKAAGTGALVGFIVQAALAILLVVLYIAFMGFLFTNIAA